MQRLGLTTLATLTVVAAAAACGGRTRGNHGSPGELVTVDVATNSAQPGLSIDPVTPTAPLPDTAVVPTPGFTTINPPSLPTTPVQPGTGSSMETPATTGPIIVSPPHASDCPVRAETTESAVGYTYSDGVTSIDLQSASGSSQWCAYGIAGPAGEDYALWGAGMGAFVGYQNEMGVQVPFDASARGVVGIRFRLESKGRAVRVMLTEFDSPAISDAVGNYQNNAFIWGGSTPNLLSNYGIYELRFGEFELPAWALVPEEHQRPLDASRLHSFQFMVANDPAGAYEEFAFCVMDVAWVDACGNVIAVSVAADQTPVIPTDPMPGPSTNPDDSSQAPPETTSAPRSDVSSFGDVTSELQASSDVPTLSDAGAVDTAPTPPADDAGGQ